MYDREKVLDFARYGIMTEHADRLLDFSNGARGVIVKNPYISAAAAAVAVIRQDFHNPQQIYGQNKSPIPPPAHYQPVIYKANALFQQQGQLRINEPISTKSSSTVKQPSNAQRQPRATCTFCNKSFGHLGDYNKHRRRHTGERPYACDSCPRRFAHTSNLQRHRRLHSGEKPFACITCTKKFSRKDKLAAHVARRCCKPIGV